MKTRQPIHRIIAALCAAVMLFGLLPVIPVTRAESAGCGTAHGGHSEWTALTAETTELTAGDYYLSGNLKLDASVSITGKVHLCLNGHTLTGAAAPYFTVQTGGELTLCDCSSTKAGTISGIGVANTARSGLIDVAKDATLNMYGGTISGHTTTAWTGAVRVIGTFTMFDGAIVNNTATRGGAINVNGGKFYMKGGNIGAENAGNSAQYGGAIYMDGTNSVLEISGGEICYNTAVAASGTSVAAGGSALYMNNTSNAVTISGGKIHHNKANYNTSTNCRDNVTIHGYGTVINISGGTIEDNTTLDGATPATAVFLQYHASYASEVHVTGSAVIKDRGISRSNTGCKITVGALKLGAYAISQIEPTIDDETVSVGVDANTSLPSYSFKPSAIFTDDFEGGVIDANWYQSVGANVSADPALSVVTGEAYSGEYALKIADNFNGSSGQAQVMRTVTNTLPAGTELILTAYAKIESSNNVGSVAAQLISNTHVAKADLTKTGQWQKLTTIATTGTGATFNVWLASNSTQAGVAYFDDVSLQILTEKLAINYLEELLAAEAPKAAEILALLKTNALDLDNVDDSKIEGYITALQAAGTGLTKAVIQTCINNPDAPVASVLFTEDFESYTVGEVVKDTYLGENLWLGTGSAPHGPFVVDTQAHGGTKSIYINDDASNGNLQLRMNTNMIPHGKPAGTEIITTMWHKAEDNANGTSRGYYRMSLGSKNYDVYVTSTGEWEPLSVIGTTTAAGQSPRLWLVSNVADVSKTYYDDIIVQVLTEELALSYLEEKLQANAPSASLVMSVLTTKALGLSEVDKDLANAYTAELKEFRQNSQTALTKEQVQTCIASVNFDGLVESLEDPEELVVGITGQIDIPVTLPAGVSAEWVAVEPTAGKITVAEGKATVTAVPAKNEPAEAYTLTLRLSCAGKNEDIAYPVKLVNDSDLAAKLLEDTRKALASGNMVLGISSTGAVSLPAGSDANGVTAAWTAIKTNPNNRLTLNEGVLSVASLPSRRNSDEALVTLTISRGDFSVDLEYTLVIYDSTEHRLVEIPNPGFEVLDETGYAKGWAPYASHTEFLYTQISSEFAHTGENSLMIYDTQELQSMGARYPFATVPVEVGYDYEATVWARGNGTGGAILYLYFYKNDVDNNKNYASSFGDFPVNEDGWVQANIRGTATGGSVYLNLMPYSNQKGYGTVYYDDLRVWKITKAGILAEIDDLLTATDADASVLYTRLDSPLLGVGTLTSANAERYLQDLAAKRTAKGSALTDSELTAAVSEINTAVNAENTNDVNSAAAEIPATIDMYLPGIIPVPSVSVKDVTLKWASVSADTNKRILLTGTSAKVMSLPASGEVMETATMTLTLTKGSATKNVTISVKLHPFTENINALAAAANKLDISDYLDGQKPNRVIRDLSQLPTTLEDGIAVTWKALDTADTTKNSGAMDAQGKVVRPGVGEADSGVLLQAVLTRNGESYIREFYLLVSAVEADEVRELGSWEKDFEETLSSTTAAPNGWLKTDLYVTTSPLVLTEYAAVTDEQVFSGNKALRLTTTEGITAQLRSVFDLTGREGYLYSLQAMVYTESAANPEITISFWDNEGLLISSKTGKYLAGSDEASIWKNISVFAVAPVGTSAVTATLTGSGGIVYFDDVRLWEYPVVTNASFDLGTFGWDTTGEIKDGKLSLNKKSAQSAVKPAIAGVPYVLAVTGSGDATFTLRFLNEKNQPTDFIAKLGSGAVFAYAPADAVNLQVLIDGTAEIEKVQVAFGGYGTTVRDGSFEESASGKVGTPWTLDDAVISTNSGKNGAGVTVQPGGSAVSNVIPVYEGRDYMVSADVLGGGSLEIEYFTTGSTAGKVKRETITASGDGWQRIVLDSSQLTDNASGAVTVYLRVNLKANGKTAVFDNVTIYPVTDSVSNGSMENLNLGIAGSFPVHWQAYGPGIAYVANQTGEATEGIKSLGLSVFGLGEAGVRSSLIRDVIPGKAYEASVRSKGNAGVLTLEFWDAELNLVLAVGKAMSSAEWAKVSVEGTAPADAVYATVSVGGQGTGNVLVDEAAMVPVVKEIHSNIQLLMDDYMIKSASGVERTFYEGKKYTTEGGVIAPVFNGADTFAQIYGTVLYDAEQKMYGEADGEPGIYRMWYQTTSYRVAYAESKDGINWVAPKLGLTDFNGSKENNILNVKGSTDPVYSVFAVFKDEKEANPDQRFKMVTHNRIQSHSEGWYELWASPDGLTWEKVANIMQGQDVANVSYDPVNEVYVGTFKVSINTKRTHAIAISKDLINWTEPIKMFSVDTLQDCTDYLRADSYGNGTYCLGDSYVGFDWRFLINEGAMGGVADVALMFSRDLTEDWQRFFDGNNKPPIAIPLGEGGTFDDGFIVTASTAITMGDETWLYYGGWDGDHGNGISRTAKVGLVKWRLNGFASMDFGKEPGVLETSLFTFEGNSLQLNANVAGKLVVELLDQNGRVVDQAVVTGDDVDHTVVWENATALASLQGQPVSLRFSGTEAQLYSFQVRNEDSVATITYQDGDEVYLQQSVLAGSKLTQPEAPVKEGYTFVGWYNGETAYDFNTAVTGDLTLTAKWSINKYTVTFDSGVAAQTVEHGAKAAKPADPVKEGYTFAGWYNGETAYDFDAAVTESISLTAKWEVKPADDNTGDNSGDNAGGNSGGDTGTDEPSKTGDMAMPMEFTLLATMSITALAVILIGKKKLF